MCGGQRRTFWELVLSCFVFEAEELLLSAAELCTPGSLTSKLPDDSVTGFAHGLQGSNSVPRLVCLPGCHVCRAPIA